jgi:hypothetical protein
MCGAVDRAAALSTQWRIETTAGASRSRRLLPVALHRLIPLIEESL